MAPFLPLIPESAQGSEPESAAMPERAEGTASGRASRATRLLAAAAALAAAALCTALARKQLSQRPGAAGVRGAVKRFDAEASPLLEAARLANLTTDTGALTRAENTLQNAIDLEKSGLHHGSGPKMSAAAHDDDWEPSKYDCIGYDLKSSEAETDVAMEVKCCLHHQMACPFTHKTSHAVPTFSTAAPTTAVATSSSVPSTTASSAPAESTSAKPLGEDPTAGLRPEFVDALVVLCAGSVAAALCLLLCACRSNLPKPSDDDSDVDNEDNCATSPDHVMPNTAQALRGSAHPEALGDAPRSAMTKGARELRELAVLIAELEPTLALPAGAADAAADAPSASLQAEAARQVERILAARDMRAVLGDGAQQRRAEFRRLALLLHPDKRLVAGERASLAMRRLVDSYRTLQQQ